MSDGRVHRVRESASEPDGALILLHGRGADEHDLVPLFDVLDPERRLVGLTPGAPLPGPGGGRWWYQVPRVGSPGSGDVPFDVPAAHRLPRRLAV